MPLACAPAGGLNIWRAEAQPLGGPVPRPPPHRRRASSAAPALAGGRDRPGMRRSHADSP